MTEIPYSIIREKKLFIFDIDGTISLDNRLFKRTKEVFEKLHSQGKFIYLATNNSSKLPAHYIGNLARAGLDTEKINLISSLDLSLSYLRENGMNRIYPAANETVLNYIIENGFAIDGANPDAILLTYDTELDYKKLLKITELLHKNTPYFATHTDFVCPTDLGYYVPDIGSFIALISAATNKLPDKTFGKPEHFAITRALTETKQGKKDAIIIGDRLYTDIELANRAGVHSILVLSGETTQEMSDKSLTKSTFVMSNVDELCDYL